MASLKKICCILALALLLPLPAAAEERGHGMPAGSLTGVPERIGQDRSVPKTGRETETAAAKTDGSALTVRLIGGDVLEIEYPEPVLSPEQAQELFTVTVSGTPVEWEYLSYFDFGPYGERGGVVSIRLGRSLDVGQPAMYAGDVCIVPSTQEENGPAAAATVCVSCGEEKAEPVFVPFWSEIRYVEETGAAVWVAVGAENDDVPEQERSLTVHLLGAERSVYEDPAYRALYIQGITYDTFSRLTIPGGNGAPAAVRAAGV